MHGGSTVFLKCMDTCPCFAGIFTKENNLLISIIPRLTDYDVFQIGVYS